MDQQTVKLHEAFDPLFARYDALMAQIAEYKSKGKAGAQGVTIHEQGRTTTPAKPLTEYQRLELQDANKRGFESLKRVNERWLGE